MKEQQSGMGNMARIPAGQFKMGDGVDGFKHALPVHEVDLACFKMDECEVTKSQWETVYKWAIAKGYQFDNAGDGKQDNLPVVMVNWYDVVKWCNARSEMEGQIPAYYTSEAKTTVYRTGQVDLQNDWVKWNAGYRLPTEAEWEYAARGGGNNRFPFGDLIDHGRANYFSNASCSYDQGPTAGYHPEYTLVSGMPSLSPVGSFVSNGYGLFDMAGNVWEWCWDWFGKYEAKKQSNPRGPEAGSYRIIRGGSWDSYASFCRVSFRNYSHRPSYARVNVGFRVVLPAPEKT